MKKHILRGEQFMKSTRKKAVKYKNETIGKIRIIDDFLPPPKDLVLKDESIKVTLALNKSSVDFFKQEAKKHKSKYQQMIRVLLEQYTQHYLHAKDEERGKLTRKN